MNTTELINFGSGILKKSKISSYNLDSEIILSNILNIPREKLLTNEENISNKTILKFKSLILRRSKQEPVAYIIGNKEFMSKNFFINHKSLIPRPETELLIDPIIKIYKDKKLFFLDIGIGSGCILLSILNYLRNSRGIGIDICKKTLANSRINLKRFKLSNRAKLLHKSVDEIRNIKFDLVLSNPPYVLKRDIKRLSNDIQRFEPRIALDGGNDGLDVIKKVIYKSKYILKSNGILALEIGNGQYSSVSTLLKTNNFRQKFVLRDYKKNIRCIFSTLLK
mgnify:CR=1 FL=1